MKLAAALGASAWLILAAPALAASYPGEEVTVNPGAFGNGYLLYPGGKYGRHVGALLQPGERRAAPLRLHMPVKHAARPRPRVATAPPATTIDTLSPPANMTVPPPRRTAHAAPPPSAPPPSGDMSALPEDSAARLLGGGGMAAPPAHNPPPKPAKPAKPAAAPPAGDAAIPFSFGGPTAPPPRRTANTTPPARTPPPPAAGLKRQSVVPFAEGASSPASADVNAIHGLATQLNAALAAGAARVQLEAYGGPRGDKSSDSRRLSLKRALVVRELLIEDGVPSEKIDVRAMGGADDSGAADRVDVLLRS